MNLPVHSGPAECKLEGRTFRCPNHHNHTIPSFEKFQWTWAIFQPESCFTLFALTSYFAFGTKARERGPSSPLIKLPQLAEGEGLPEKSPFREVLAVLPVYARGFAPLSLSPSFTKAREAVSSAIRYIKVKEGIFWLQNLTHGQVPKNSRRR